MKKLIAGLALAIVTSLGLTMSASAPAHADRVGPYDNWGTYPDQHYGTSIVRGVFGQTTWSKSEGIAFKHKWQDLGSNKEVAYTSAVTLCASFAVPMGIAACAIYVSKDYIYFKDTIDHIGSLKDQCVSIRWYAVGMWNAGRTFSPVDCFTLVDDVSSGGGSGGGGGGGGGGGSWLHSHPILRSETMGSSSVAPQGVSGGGSW